MVPFEEQAPRPPLESQLAPSGAGIKDVADPSPLPGPSDPSPRENTLLPGPTSLPSGGPSLEDALQQGCTPDPLLTHRLWEDLHYAGHGPRAGNLRADPQ